MNASVSLEVSRLVNQFRSYQDAKRVVSDVSNVAKKYRSMVPKRGNLILNTGQECQLVMLEGTLPTYYRGQQYHTPVEIYITENYPMSPPTCYIRPTSGMSLRKGHKHVDNSGLVYLPYLHEWAARTHDLVELCVKMSSVFGADPPLFAAPVRATPSTSTPQRSGSGTPQPGASPFNVGRQQPLQQERPHSDISGQQSLQQHLQPNERPRSATSGAPQVPHHQQQQQAAAPQVTTTLSPPLRPLPPTPSPEDMRKEKELELTRKLQGELQAMYNQLRSHMDTAFETQWKLERKQGEVDADVEELSRRNKELERLVEVAKQRLAELNAYLEERAKEGEPSVDDLIEPHDNLSDKMLALVAENAAIEDVLYYLDAGVTDGVITVEDFLKEVRRLARKQFMARATIRKVEKAQRKLKQDMAASNNHTAAGSAAHGGFDGGRGYYPSLPPMQQTPPADRGYMNGPPPKYTPTPTGGDRSVGVGYSSSPPYGQAAWGVGATAGRGGYPTVGTGSSGRGAYGAQGPYKGR